MSLVRRLSAKSALLLLLALLLGASLTASCGGGGSSPSPTPTPSPVSPTPPAPSDPSAPLPFVDGDWTGTLESSGFPAKAIAARFVQPSPDCIDGSWTTKLPDARWVGAISVLAYPGTLDGFMSFEIPGSGSKQCTGVGTLTGEATNDTATLTWAITSSSADSCAGTNFPSRFTVKLKR